MVRKAEVKAINYLSENPSKEEEINFLAHIAGSIPETSYLKSFFTPEMVRKLEQNIRNDFCSDFDEMIGQIVSERTSLIRAQMEEQLETERAEMLKTIRECEERAQKAEEEARNAKRAADEAWTKLDQISRISSGF